MASVPPKSGEATEQITGVFYYKVRVKVQVPVTITTTVEKLETVPGYQYDPQTGANLPATATRKVSVPQTSVKMVEREITQFRQVTLCLPIDMVENGSTEYDTPIFLPGQQPKLSPLPAAAPPQAFDLPPAGPHRGGAEGMARRELSRGEVTTPQTSARLPSGVAASAAVSRLAETTPDSGVRMSPTPMRTGGGFLVPIGSGGPPLDCGGWGPASTP